jgi:hypothetical protein
MALMMLAGVVCYCVQTKGVALHHGSEHHLSCITLPQIRITQVSCSVQLDAAAERVAASSCVTHRLLHI